VYALFSKLAASKGSDVSKQLWALESIELVNKLLFKHLII